MRAGLPKPCCLHPPIEIAGCNKKVGSKPTPVRTIIGQQTHHEHPSLLPLPLLGQDSGVRSKTMSIKKLKPAISKYWLFIIAGVMWSAVGMMLIWRALGWFSVIEGGGVIVMALLGVVLAFAIYYFMFSKIARKNIKRLCLHPEKVCLFAFQSWQGYLIIVVMVSLGIGLRNSPFPKPWLAVIYTGIGGGLFLASLHFYERVRQMVYLQQPCLQDEGES